MHLANKNGYTFKATSKFEMFLDSTYGPRAGAGIPPAFIMTIGPNFQSLG